MSTVIKVENLSKQYRLGLVGTGTFKEDTKRFWARLRGKEDPYSIVGEENDRTSKGTSNFVWSLRDINFEVKQGDVLGIIGKNGAGKSTLLKILSKVTTPTTGSIKAKGRIASLLEVGTGFHPELTGRENIYLNGAILGMRKHEITRKLDEIIAFAGVERYIDTPVKRYSSGMYVRLAFAVAAHLENEILIIDEVLAVGDADFQKKCLAKMGDVSKGEGRTVLFVSHNINSISTLTNKSILLKNGSLELFSVTKDVVQKYFQNSENNKSYFSLYSDEISRITKVEIKTTYENSIQKNEDEIRIFVTVNTNRPLFKGSIAIQINNSLNQSLVNCSLFDSFKPIFLNKGTHLFECIIPRLKLFKGKYNISVFVAENQGITILDSVENICFFEVNIFDKNNYFELNDDACIYFEDYYWD